MVAQDPDGDHVDFGFVGGPDSIFTLQGHTGKFWILPNSIPTYDINGQNTYEYTFAATDGKGGRADQTIYVHILPGPTTLPPTISPNNDPVWTSDPNYYITENENVDSFGQFGNIFFEWVIILSS